MLNEEKIQAMTDLAVFEKHQGRKIFPVNQYFKSDYVGGQLFRSFFGYTFSFALILLMWILYKLDVLMKGADIDQLIGWIRNWGLAYVTGLEICDLGTVSRYPDHAEHDLHTIQRKTGAEITYQNRMFQFPSFPDGKNLPALLSRTSFLPGR